MVRRIGFGGPDGAETARPGPKAANRAARPPEVRRNWTGIVIQCVWVDLWLVGLYEIGRRTLDAVTDGASLPPTDLLLLFAAVAIGALLSFRRLIRLLRGEPVTSSGS